MIIKELRTARWLIMLAIVVVFSSAMVVPLAYPAMLNIPEYRELPEFQDFTTYLGSQWFGQNVFSILGSLAILLGAFQIAGEVRRKTIFLLLSRPLSRMQIFMGKYASSALVLGILHLLASLVMYGLSLYKGADITLVAVIGAVINGWLGLLFILGISLVCSVIFNDPLVVVLISGVVVVSLVVLEPLVGARWSPAMYWFDLQSFHQATIPWLYSGICAVLAAIPAFLAFYLFKNRSF